MKLITLIVNQGACYWAIQYYILKVINDIEINKDLRDFELITK